MKIFLKLIGTKNVNMDYVKWLNNKNIVKFTEQRYVKTKLSDVFNFIKKTNKSKNTFVYGIFLSENKKHIGNITLGPINFKHKSAEIGFFLGFKKYWNKGIMSNAIKQIIIIAKNKFKVKKLLAGCYEINKSSRKLLIKNNFILEGKLRSQVIFNKKRNNYLIFGYNIK